MIAKVTSQASVLVNEVSPKRDNNVKTQNIQSKEVDRLSELKEQIKNGDYKVNLTKAAEAVAQEMI